MIYYSYMCIIVYTYIYIYGKPYIVYSGLLGNDNPAHVTKRSICGLRGKSSLVGWDICREWCECLREVCLMAVAQNDLSC